MNNIDKLEERMKKDGKNKKEIKLPLEFNPGTLSYQPKISEIKKELKKIKK